MYRDYIPGGDAEFDEFQTEFSTTVVSNGDRWGISIDAAQELRTKGGRWDAAYAKTCNANTRTHADTLEKNEARDDYEKEIRKFVKAYVAYNPAVTDLERDKMGLRKPDTVHTVHSRPESQPVVAAENTRNNYEHKVVAVNRDNNRAAKPADAYGVRFAWKTGGERPASGDDLPKSRFSRKTTITVVHSEADKGKPAYYACCYENAKGEQGPWSPVVEAYIA